MVGYDYLLRTGVDLTGWSMECDGWCNMTTCYGQEWIPLDGSMAPWGGIDGGICQPAPMAPWSGTDNRM